MPSGDQYVTDPAVIGNDTEPSARVASPETPGVSLRAVRASVKPESGFTAVEPPRTSGTDATGAGIFDDDDETVWMVGVAAWAEEMPNAAPPSTRAPVVARVMEVFRLLRMVICPLLRCRARRGCCVRAEHTLVQGGEPAMCGW